MAPDPDPFAEILLVTPDLTVERAMELLPGWEAIVGPEEFARYPDHLEQNPRSPASPGRCCLCLGWGGAMHTKPGGDNYRCNARSRMANT